MNDAKTLAHRAAELRRELDEVEQSGHLPKGFVAELIALETRFQEERGVKLRNEALEEAAQAAEECDDAKDGLVDTCAVCAAAIRALKK